MFPQLHIIIPHTGHSAVGFYIIILVKLHISEAQHPQAGIFLYLVKVYLKFTVIQIQFLQALVVKNGTHIPIHLHQVVIATPARSVQITGEVSIFKSCHAFEEVQVSQIPLGIPYRVKCKPFHPGQG